VIEAPPCVTAGRGVGRAGVRFQLEPHHAVLHAHHPREPLRGRRQGPGARPRAARRLLHPRPRAACCSLHPRVHAAGRDGACRAQLHRPAGARTMRLARMATQCARTLCPHMHMAAQRACATLRRCTGRGWPAESVRAGGQMGTRRPGGLIRDALGEATGRGSAAKHGRTAGSSVAGHRPSQVHTECRCTAE
jgi:hypothetical protein